MIDTATTRCERIGKAWPAAKAEALGEVKEDWELVVNDFTKINPLITKWERDAKQEPLSLLS